MGFNLRTNDAVDDSTFPNVVIAAPPSGSDDYAVEVCPQRCEKHKQSSEMYHFMDVQIH